MCKSNKEELEDLDRMIESIHTSNVEDGDISSDSSLHEKLAAVLDSTNTHIKMHKRLKKILLEFDQIAVRKNSELPIDRNNLELPSPEGKQYFDDFDFVLVEKEDTGG